MDSESDHVSLITHQPVIIESEGSGDEYKDEDGPESESESEVDEQEEPKPTNIKGRKSGHTERSLLSPP